LLLVVCRVSFATSVIFAISRLKSSAVSDDTPPPRSDDVITSRRKSLARVTSFALARPTSL